MLVLSRKKQESIDIGDEVFLTVEEILAGEDGKQSVTGATVRLGFQSPRNIPIFRTELRNAQWQHGRGGKAPKPPRPRPGECVKIPNARTRLRVEVPEKIPVRCNGELSIPLDSDVSLDQSNRQANVIHQFTCREEDRIAICNNIIIMTLSIHRFVFLSRISN